MSHCCSRQPLLPGPSPSLTKLETAHHPSASLLCCGPRSHLLSSLPLFLLFGFVTSQSSSIGPEVCPLSPQNVAQQTSLHAQCHPPPCRDPPPVLCLPAPCTLPGSFSQARLQALVSSLGSTSSFTPQDTVPLLLQIPGQAGF